MLFLKQNTAATIIIGPMVSDSDGYTPETGLTISQADVRLSKNGGAFAQKNDSNACTHMENGYYSCQLDATDTNTLGRLVVAVSESGALPVWKEFMVIPANVYDSLVGGSDKLQTDAVEISGSSAAADAVESNIGNLDAAVSGVKNQTDKLTFDASNRVAADARAISASTAAADALEANISNLDEASSTLLSAIFNIGVAAASAAKVAEGRAITSGTETGTYENTYALDETYHVITADGGEIDLYYDFTLSDDSVPVAAHVKGRLHEGSTPGGGDSVDIYVYDWTTSSWEQVVPPLGGFVGVANSDSDDDEVRVIPLFPRHKDSSTNKVRVRFAGSSLEANTALYVDQIYLTHTAVLSYSGIASSILATPANKLKTDSDGYAQADAVKISGSEAAANSVEANIGNLDVAVSSRSTFDPSSDKVDVGKWAGASVATGTTSGMPKVDIHAINDNISAADTLESNVSNMDAKVSEIKAQTDKLRFEDNDVKATLDGEKVNLNDNQATVTIGTVNALGNQAKTDVKGQCGQALGDYGAAKASDVQVIVP